MNKLDKMKKINPEKRITFTQPDAHELYELSLEHFQLGCVSCDRLKKKLEIFLGEEEVKQITKTIKKNGYCNRLGKKEVVFVDSHKRLCEFLMIIFVWEIWFFVYFSQFLPLYS